MMVIAEGPGLTSMDRIKLSIITQNFNSYSYLPLSMLSLYSAFKTLAELGNIAEGRVLLIDSSSTDGSYEKLCRLGSELSRKTAVDFECRRLNKDLGNSFAITYGFLLEKRRGTNYLLNMDNDFIILHSNAVREMVDLAEEFDLLKTKYHAITTMYIMGNRDRFLKHLNSNEKQDLDEAMNFVYRDAENSNLIMPNIGYVNVLNRPFPLLPVVSRKDFNSIINEKGCPPKVLISAFVPATFTLYNPSTAPIPPYFYILGDDISSGLEHAKRGYLNVVLTKFGGIHYIATSQKVNSVRLYFGFRNSVLCNSSTGLRGVLHKFTWLVYSILYSTVGVFNLRHVIKQGLAFSELLMSSYYYSNMKLKPYIAKYAVLGALHGTMSSHRFKRKIERWFSKFVLKHGVDYLDYTRLDYTTWSNSSFSLKNLLLYLIMPEKAVRKDVGVNILSRRLRRN